MVLIVSVWGLSVPVAVAATSSITASERNALLVQIKQLQQELARLQELLRQQQTDTSFESFATVSAYGSTFQIERSYQVSQVGTLTPYPPRAIDQSLFSLWNALIGTSTTITHVNQWQIFNAPKTALGAYVETSGGQGDWIISVNRAGYNAAQRSERQAFAELFVHEYAHLLLYELPEVTTAFAARFWNERDQSHRLSLQTLSLDAMTDTLARYYARNQTRFVSEYATVNTNEDLAETFLALVFNPASEKEQSMLADKQRFLLADPTIAMAVLDIRNNLSRLGLE